MKGVLDRFEGTKAVILVEKSKEEFTIPRDQLPDYSTEGVWFHLGKSEGHYFIHSIDIETTESKSTANSLLVENLRKSGQASKFKRDDQ